MSSNEPVEYCLEMYRTLLKYAQTFERYEPYRAGMVLEKSVRQPMARSLNTDPMCLAVEDINFVILSKTLSRTQSRRH